jgi:hypothetical protein
MINTSNFNKFAGSGPDSRSSELQQAGDESLPLLLKAVGGGTVGGALLASAVSKGKALRRQQVPLIGGIGLYGLGEYIDAQRTPDNVYQSTTKKLKQFMDANPEVTYYIAPTLLGSLLGGYAWGKKGALGLGLGGLGLGALARYLKDNPI